MRKKTAAPEIAMAEPVDLADQKDFEKAARRPRARRPKQTPVDTPKSPPKAAAGAPDAPEKPDPAQLVGFWFDVEGGLWFTEKKGDVYQPPTWVCAPFGVKYRLRTFDGLGWRTLLQITDRDGVQREVSLLDADVGGQDGAWHKALSDAGLKIDPRRRGLLGLYLLTKCDEAPRARTTDKTGLFHKAYVLHARTIGASEEPILYMGADRTGVFSESGTAAAWRDHIGRYAVGNSRMVLAVCLSFAGPLLPLSGIGESGGIHLWGSSGDGKTTLAKVAASGWGRPKEYMTTWRNTSNATEGQAAKFNHFLLVLDEIREAAERDLQPTVMMLGNNGGKSRMRDDTSVRARLTWLLLWFSTGEFATNHYLEQSGIKSDPGMTVRQVDLPSDAGRHMGVFEQLHEFKTAKAMALHLNAACDAYHGAVGIAWLEYITSNIDDIGRDLPAAVAAMADKLVEKHADAESQVHRVIRRFALLAVAGELATKAGLTGWQPGVATWGIGQCVDAWLNHRGGAENLEERRILERLRDFIGRNWQGRFIPWARATDDRAPSKSEAVGYSKDADNVQHADGSGSTPQQEFYITPEGWNEIFRGMDPAKAGEVLLARGVLLAGKWNRPPETRAYRREYLPGMGRRQCYRTVPGLFDLLGDTRDEEMKNA